MSSKHFLLATIVRIPKSLSRKCVSPIDQEQDGRYIAEVPELPGALAYGQTREEAIARVQALALRVLAERLDHGEPLPQVAQVFAVAA